jgi:uncharacterized membrane protein
MFDTNHIHPMIVHFPVALIITGFLTSVLSLSFKKLTFLAKIADFLMVLGTFAAFAGYFSGEFFTAEMQGAAGELKENHELFAKITMFVMLAATVIRLYFSYLKKDETKFKWLVFCLYGIAMITVGITGYLGGTLVYNYMMPL